MLIKYLFIVKLFLISNKKYYKLIEEFINFNYIFITLYDIE